MKAVTNGKEVCLIEECSRQRATRGLCRGCYQAALRWINLEVITDEELVKLGLMLPHSMGKRNNDGLDRRAGVFTRTLAAKLLEVKE